MNILENSNPKIFQKTADRALTTEETDENIHDPIDSREVFDYIKSIKDPEHPLTLEELNVVHENCITVDDPGNQVQVYFSPTVPHCSMATLIGIVYHGLYSFSEDFKTGLSVRVQLLRVLPPRLKVTVSVTPGTHASEEAVNKQLNDKERVAAALENPSLMMVINQCIAESL